MRLRNDRNTLATIHNRLVNLLHKQRMEKNDSLQIQIKETSKPERALLLQEVGICDKRKQTTSIIIQFEFISDP